MSDEIRKLEKERDYWKRVAAYLAGCHAATLSHDGMLRSTSRSRRERLVNIVAIASDMMKGQDWRAGSGYARSTPQSAFDHCQEALKWVAEETE